MKFSLIVATLGRSSEVARLFDSLLNQTYKEFEVILVDQNPDHRVFDIYNQYKEKLQIQYIHTDKKGLSHARNLGLKCQLHDIVAFPDDDCWYAKDILARIDDLFKSNSCDIVTGQPVDAQEKPLVNNYLTTSCDVNLRNVWNTAISFTVFLRKSAVIQIGSFDENLGVGCETIYGSGEETDYLIKALEDNLRIRYMPDLKIFHPRKISVGDAKEYERALLYGAGMGYVLKKHHYDISFKLRALIRPLGGAVLALGSGNLHMCRFRLNTFVGRLKGLRAKIKEQ